MLRNLLRRSPANRLIAGTPQIGLLASQIVSETATGDQGAGLLYDDALANTGKLLRVKVTSWSGTAGALAVYENGSVLIEGQADGAYTIGYDWEAWAANGTLTSGSDTASVQIGPQGATALGSTVTGTGTVSSGAASGEQNATAPGADVIGTGSITAGSADGQGNATAPGADVAGTGTLSAGTADGQGNATAPGAAVTGQGTITAGDATGGTSGDASAPGASVNGNGTVTAGDATGEQNSTAPGATLSGSGTVTAGQAAGDQDATAPGAVVSGAGSISAGSANQQTAALPIIVARAIASQNIRSGIKPTMQTITGNTARIDITVSDHQDLPVDPSQITIKIIEPGQPVSTATPVKDAAGHYHHDILLNRPGKWYWRVETEGQPAAASEGQISVTQSRFS